MISLGCNANRDKCFTVNAEGVKSRLGLSSLLEDVGLIKIEVLPIKLEEYLR